MDKAPTRILCARWISIIGHPFVFIVLLLLVPFWRRNSVAAARVTVVVTLLVLVPFAVISWQRFKSGRWSTVDASHPTERRGLLLAILLVLVPVTLYFLYFERSSNLVHACAAIACMTGVGMLLNRWIKLSGHMAIAGFAAVIFGHINIYYGLAIGVFIPLIGWSRLALARHTLAEVLGGLAGGLLTGWLLLQL